MAPHAQRPAAALRPSSRRAFTLIELLVVVALISAIALGFGLALKDTGGNALASGQTLLATMVGTARAQAAVNQTTALLVVYNTRPPLGDAEKYLRLMQVFRDETPTAGSRTWVPVGNAVTLPRGIFFVPQTTNGLLAQGVIWPSNPPLLSTVATAPTPASALNQPTGTPFGGNVQILVMQFGPDGTVTQVGTQAYARLLVATGTVANNIPQFNNANAVRGLLIRPSGAVTFVNAATDF